MRTAEATKPSGPDQVARQSRIDGREEAFPGGLARLGLGSVEGDARAVGGILRFNLARRGE